MRSVGIENSVTSLALTTHQANNEQYQRSADEAENFVNGSTAPTASPLKKRSSPPSKSPRGKLKTNSCARRSIYSIGSREYTTSRNRKKLGCSSLAPMN
tara:strand:+ start:2431 stop:2727 length:297 start_codon:yes stop_codon:yes gene_type:complete